VFWHDVPMSKRALAWLAAVSAAAVPLSIFLLDRPIALAVRASGFESAAWIVAVRDFLDIFTGRGLVGNHVGLGQLLLGALFFSVGLAWTLAARANPVPRGLAFAGAVQIVTIETAWQVKDFFGRLRPYQLLESGDWSHLWFAGGSSFPSGHVAFFWGLFVPLAYAFPRWRYPLFVIPVFIALARVDENFHFLGDVLGSIALSAGITLAAAAALGRWVKPVTAAEPPKIATVPHSA